MNEQGKNKRKTSIDELNEQLYYQKGDFKERPRRKIHDRDITLKKDFPEDGVNEWKKEAKKRRLPTSFFKKMFLIVLLLFVVTAIVALSSFYSGKKTVSGDLISLEILGQPLVDGGENLQLQVRIQNFNEQPLELPDLVLSYPKDSREEGEQVFMRRSLDDVQQGDRAIEEFSIILFGQEGDTREINAKLEYRINNSNAIFFKEATHEVIIRSTPTTLSINAPEEMVRGQIFEMDINLASNSNMIVNNTLLELKYPDGFEFISSEPESNALNRIWSFPLLRNEAETITVRGRLSALEGQGQSFGINFGRQHPQRINEIETFFNRLVHTVDIQQPFISTSLELNGSTEDLITIRGGNDVDGEISFVNTTDDVLQDVAIKMNLGGSLYNPVGIRAQNGFFNSNTLSLSWDKTTSSSFNLLEPGEERTVSFNLPTQELVGRTGALTNPELELSIDVTASEINGNLREAYNVSQARVIANSDIEILGKVEHDEGPFENTGPMPPRVGETTSYTVTLQVTNSSNNLTDAELRFYLPSYVQWMDAIAPSVERNAVEYNQTTREVIWDLDRLRAGLGISGSSPRSLSFQVEVLPSLPQAGDQIALTSEIILSGTDSFTETDLSYRKNEIENRLSGSQEAGADGRVR